MDPILIIGAGISGLTLAHACRKENLPYRIFERDESPDFRSAGWGLTLNWSLPYFSALLPDDVASRLPESHVNTAAVEAGEKGSFTFFDLSTGEAKWKVPASERMRVSRQRLRKLMLSGLDIEWSKGLSDVTKDESGVHTHFADGTTATGSLLVACDGAHSSVRRLIHPETHANYDLPVRFIGARPTYSESQIADMLKLDPYFFQGSDPQTDVFLWFSYLETPGDPGAPEPNEHGEKMYRCQVMTSWPYREGFFGRAEPSNMPNTEIGQRAWMKALSKDWVEPFRSVVQNLPRDSEIRPIELSDWIPQRNTDLVFDGRVVLLGDAQHAMVPFRGDAANHAIVDVSVLLERIKPIFQTPGDVASLDEKFKDAVKSYENEVVERTELAVLASRRACLDANDYKRLNDKSPLVNKRVMKVDLDALQSNE